MSKSFYCKKGGSLKSFLMGHNTITLNIKEFNKQQSQIKKNEKKLANLVQEAAIARMILKMKFDMDQAPYYVFKNLCEVLQIYDEYIYWYTAGEPPLPVTNEQAKENTKAINNVKFLSKKKKEKIIAEFKELHKEMSDYDQDAAIQNNTEVDHKEFALQAVMWAQVDIMEDFLKNGSSKSFMKMHAIYKYDKNNKYRRTKVFDKKNLKNYNNNGNQHKIIDQILRFYDRSRMHFPKMQKWENPIVEYKNELPVFDPKFFKGIIHANAN